jgi:hypothetical protein
LRVKKDEIELSEITHREEIKAVYEQMNQIMAIIQLLFTCSQRVTKKILEQKTITWEELKFLKNLGMSTIYRHLLLPDVESFRRKK